MEVKQGLFFDGVYIRCHGFAVNEGIQPTVLVLPHAARPQPARPDPAPMGAEDALDGPALKGLIEQGFLHGRAFLP